MFGNEMLFSSWFFTSVVSAFIVTQIPKFVLKVIPKVVRVTILALLLPVMTFVLKVAISKALRIRDDVSSCSYTTLRV